MINLKRRKRKERKAWMIGTVIENMFASSISRQCRAASIKKGIRHRRGIEQNNASVENIISWRRKREHENN